MCWVPKKEEDMAMVQPEMLVADWHLASSELGSSRIPTHSVARSGTLYHTDLPH